MNFVEIGKAFLAIDKTNQAVLALQRALSQSPDNPEAWELLGLAARRAGDLTVAAEAYAQWHRLAPADSRAAYLYAIFHEQPLPSPPPQGAISPAPFARWDKFLSSSERQQVWDWTLAHQHEFAPERVFSSHGAKRDDSRCRAQHLFNLGPLRGRVWQRVEQMLPGILPRLGFAPFSIDHLELRITQTPDGGFFAPHQDSGVGTPSRKFSFMYYFHFADTQFRGGDLLLYDTAWNQLQYDRAAYTRIAPQPGSLVFFPSNSFHEVTQVQLADDRFAHGRFVLGGDIHAAAEAQRESSDC